MSDSQKKLDDQLINVIIDKKVSSAIRVKRVKYLIELGAFVHVRDENGKSVLDLAKNTSDKELYDFLKEVSCARFWNVDGKLKSLEDIKDLLKKGKNVNELNECYNTPLIYASIMRQTDKVKVLLENGANVNARGQHGNTALIEASKYGFYEIVEMLLEKGADVNMQSKIGNTALIFASYNGHIEVVEKLLNNGGDVNLKNVEGTDALDSAIMGMRKDVEKMLKKHIMKEKENKEGGENSRVLFISGNDGR